MDLEVLGIPKAKINQLKNADIYSVEDLVKYIPRKYHDFRSPVSIRNLKDGDICAVIAEIKEIKEFDKVVNVRAEDGTGKIYISFFQQNYVAKILEVGTKYIFCGKVNIDPKYYTKKMTPICYSKDIYKYKKIIPVYKKIKGMSDEYLENIISTALNIVGSEDFLEDKIVKQFNLISEYEAFKLSHRPRKPEDIEKAKLRFVFDDLFLFNFQLRNLGKDKDTKSNFNVTTAKSWKAMNDSLPFELTEGQKESLKNLYYTMKSGKRVNALVQGDVGSGKTMVAIFMALTGADNGFQTCVMAPTEVLAKQHFLEFEERFKNFPYKVGFLTGSMKAKEKKQMLEQIKSGEIHIVVGTHAVIQGSVEFHNLGLVIVDEQHRFGVVQREKLNNVKGKPHHIAMTATPIPRTLSMALYGDTIQVLSIKTKPKGRKPIITQRVQSDDEVNEFMLKEIQNGRQCYVICPLIEDSESQRMANIESANAVYNKLLKAFSKYKDIKISLITGKMKVAEVDAEIKKFANKE